MYLIAKLDYDDHVIVKLVPLGFDYGTKIYPPCGIDRNLYQLTEKYEMFIDPSLKSIKWLEIHHILKCDCALFHLGGSSLAMT